MEIMKTKTSVEKPKNLNYKCKTCNKEFSKLEYVKRHEKIHSEVKPFKCDTCSQSFRESKNTD